MRKWKEQAFKLEKSSKIDHSDSREVWLKVCDGNGAFSPPGMGSKLERQRNPEMIRENFFCRTLERGDV